MATRGFIKLVNSEKSEKEPYHGFKTDQLVEACHDGYTTTMIEDILRIPETLVKIHVNGLGKLMLSPSFRGFLDPKTFTLEGFIQECYALQLIPSLDWFSILEVLQLSKPFKYGLIEIGAVRYGHPFGFEDCNLVIQEKDGNYEVEILEHPNEIDETQKWMEDQVKKTNEKLKLTLHPFTTENTKIRMNLNNGFAEAFWNQFQPK